MGSVRRDERRRPFWTAQFVYYGPRKVIPAQWEHTKDALAGIAGVKFAETASYTFPLTDEQVEAVRRQGALWHPVAEPVQLAQCRRCAAERRPHRLLADDRAARRGV